MLRPAILTSFQADADPSGEMERLDEPPAVDPTATAYICFSPLSEDVFKEHLQKVRFAFHM
jgi:hypothetical protein